MTSSNIVLSTISFDRIEKIALDKSIDNKDKRSIIIKFYIFKTKQYLKTILKEINILPEQEIKYGIKDLTDFVLRILPPNDDYICYK